MSRIFDPSSGDGSLLSAVNTAVRLDPAERQYVATKRAVYIEREAERSLRETNALMRSNRNRSFS